MPATAASPKLSERFDHALAYASTLHRRQLRKQTDIPYIAHLISVAALVLEDGGDETEAIAALLHDALEDQGRGGLTRAEIREHYGEAVLAIVQSVSDTEEEPKPAWKPRKQLYIDHLTRDASTGAVRVSLADKLHNARAILADYRTLGNRLWSRFSAPPSETVWYYTSLLEVYRERCPGPMVDELGRVIEELQRLSRTSQSNNTA